MKTCSFLVTFSLALVLANAMSTEEHVRRAFPMKHRHLLPEITSLQLQDAPAMVPKQNDESTQCLAKCEPECQRVNVPAFLKNPENFMKFEKGPIDCVLGSTVVFQRKPRYQCQFVGLYLFDCCRACNAKHEKCLKELGNFNGGPEFCYRNNYRCMCHCLGKHNPPENHHEIKEEPTTAGS
ncbi:hypothetical protein OS493_031891 [Desmophyllum pertusum]|uniref:Uncharacterized protein n=1 Tax=Desmophyllum pertusum TaxID=174260 RepID=A0A9W9Y9V9_9CNID|nr:hypothetical protein OS493_031891 [Desmophyllum pertusum]